jgi:hypothetical protein
MSLCLIMSIPWKLGNIGNIIFEPSYIKIDDENIDLNNLKSKFNQSVNASSMLKYSKIVCCI